MNSDTGSKIKVFQGIRVVKKICHLKLCGTFSIFVGDLGTFQATRRHLTGVEAAHAVGMVQSGVVQRTVAAHFNVSQSVISQLWNRVHQTGDVAARPRSGRPRSTIARQDRYLANMSKRERFQSAVKLNRDFETATGVSVTA